MRPFVGALLGVLIAGLAGIPWLRPKPAVDRAPAPVTQASRLAWVRISSDLVDIVPADILLGSAGSSAELDAKLTENHLGRDMFRRTAIAIRGDYASARDGEEEETLAMSLERVQVPEGFETRRRSESSAPVRESSPPAAHELVTKLMERLRSKPLENP